MEGNFFDEIFERINILESENKLLKEELKNINDENEVNVERFLTINPAGKLNEINEFKKNLNLEQLIFNKNDDNKKFHELIINYKPYDELNTIEIIGDFTNWKKLPMDKIGDRFVFKCKVLKGYYYKYCFYYLENKLIDYEAETIDDQFTLETNNIIRIPDNELSNKFHNQSDITAEQLYKLIENDENLILNNQEEKQLLDKTLEFAKFFNSIKSELYKNKKTSEENGRNYHEDLLKICEKYEKEKFEIYNGMFVNKIITHNDQNYLILSINFSESYFKCIKLYDKNGIRIDINDNFNLNVGNKFPFEKLYDNCFIHSKDESDKILEDYKKDDRNVLRIFYELLSLKNNIDSQYENEDLRSNVYRNAINSPNAQGEDIHMDFIDEEIKSEISHNSSSSINNNINNNVNNPIRRVLSQRFNNNNEAKEIIPYKIQPDNIDLNNYNIIIENNKIINIQSRNDDMFTIMYEAKLIKEESSNKFKGLVSNSILKVFTSMFNKDIVNIIHIHLNDTSEEISVDSLFLEKSEMVTDHKNFNLDAQGKKLNYKFIFRDFKLIKIFYNLSKDYIDEPHFEEIRLQEENIVKINYNKTIYNGFYGKVKSIPIGMLARKDKNNSVGSDNLLERKKSVEPSLQGDCEERHLEDLIGYVDVTVIFGPDMSVMEEPIVIKIPVCKLITLSYKEQIPFETILAKHANLKKKSAYNKIQNFYDNIKKLKENVLDEKKINEITIEETREYLNKFEEINLQEELNLDKLDDTEDYDYLEKVNEINNEIPEIVKRLQIHLRNYIFSQKKP